MLRKGVIFWFVVFIDYESFKEYVIKISKIVFYISWWIFFRNFLYNLKWFEVGRICFYVEFVW